MYVLLNAYGSLENLIISQETRVGRGLAVGQFRLKSKLFGLDPVYVESMRSMKG